MWPMSTRSLQCSLQPLKTIRIRNHLFSKVVHHECVGLVLIAEVCDGDTACTNNLTWKPVLVNLAEPSPFAQLLVVGNVNQWHALLSTETLDEFLVRRFVAGLG